MHAFMCVLHFNELLDAIIWSLRLRVRHGFFIQAVEDTGR